MSPWKNSAEGWYPLGAALAEIVEDAHFFPEREEALDEMAANKSGAASDKKCFTHDAGPFWRICRASFRSFGVLIPMASAGSCVS